MRGILINPFDKTIKEVNILGNIEDIYLLTECKTFDVVALSDKDDVYVDDEGLLKDNRYFISKKTIQRKQKERARYFQQQASKELLNS